MSDGDERVQCPYNFSHIVLKPRMAAHLIKCRAKFPTGSFEKCPYNATHDVPKKEYQYHLKNCPDRKVLDNFMYVMEDAKEVKKPTEEPFVPEAAENWDELACPGSSYLKVKEKKLENKLFFREPTGTKKEKKEFIKKQEFIFQKGVNEKSSNK